MLLSRQWLDEYTRIDAPDREFCERMTMSGSKVEGYAITGGGISRVVAGRVSAIERHPDSDHMFVCSVDAGTGRDLTIVTGAQNVRAGDMVPVALDGSVIAGGKEIRTGVLRGVMSQGMLCSLGELGLDRHDFPDAAEDGIWIITDPCRPGDDIAGVAGFGDTVVDFEITNNRPDCLSMIGLAREAAATFGTELSLPRPAVTGGQGSIADYLSVEVRDSQLCPRYTAMMVTDLTIAPSPKWLRRRLRASGVRPINNIVDITNYIMLEYGQPMHAFDYSCVGGGRIVVRRAGNDEVLRTLDGSDRTLNDSMLVIADESKPIGVAGVMGGGNSEITGDTRTLVFESANFNGTSVRKTAIALGMRTEASGRFEKGLDVEGTVPAVLRACQLVEELGAGRVVGGMIDVSAAAGRAVRLPLEPQRICRLIGEDIPRDFMVRALEKLGFTFDGDMMTVPSWRSDIEHFADVAEEVARFYGYDIIAPTLPSGATAQGGYSPRQEFGRECGRLMRAMGYYEVMTYSFGSASAWDRIHLPADSPLRRAFVIQNPLGEDTSVMRTTSLPSMLEVLYTNLSKRNENVKLWELASVYLKKDGQELADERTILTLGAYGGDMDFYALKGSVEALLASLRVSGCRFEALSDDPSYHPGRCASVTAEGRRLGVIGQVHPAVCSEYGFDCQVFAAELDFDAMFALRRGDPVYSPLPRFPAVTRDIAVVCGDSVTVQQLTDCITSAGGEYLKECSLFDVYRGAPIAPGKKSAAFSLVLRAEDQTLTDDHADECVSAILKALESRLGALRR